MSSTIYEIIVENKIDILAVTECSVLDADVLLKMLNGRGSVWRKIEIFQEGDMALYASNNVKVTVKQEKEHYSCYKFVDTEKEYLLFLVHLPSALHESEAARSDYAGEISRDIQCMEESFFGKEEFKSIVLGDFNLQPYSRGIMGYDSFNATMSVEHALKGYRIIKGKKKLFYYNPMWKMMGENKLVQGTYYRNRDSEGLSVYWYTFDEVLLRPYFIKKFEWTSFKILEGTNNRSFVKGNKINSKVYSDHLPIMFEVV